MAVALLTIAAFLYAVRRAQLEHDRIAAEERARRAITGYSYSGGKRRIDN